MFGGYATITLIGNLVDDPELRESRNGLEFATFTVAVNEREKKGDEWVDVTNYFDCVTFGSQARLLAEHTSKGKMIHATGKPRIESYTDKDGVNRKAFKVVVDRNGITLVSRSENKKKQAAEESVPF